MAYNLYSEGELDLFALSRVAREAEWIELFPIPADAGGPDAIGISLPSSRVGDAAIAELTELIRLLWQTDAAVYDLVSGDRLVGPDDLIGLRDRLIG